MGIPSRLIALSLAVVYVASAVYGPYRVGFPPRTEDAYTLYLYILIIYSMLCFNNKIRSSKKIRIILQISIVFLCIDYVAISHIYFPDHLPIGLNRLGFAISLMMIAVFDVLYVLVFHRELR